MRDAPRNRRLSLREQLHSLRESIVGQTPEFVRQLMKTHAASLAESGIVAQSLGLGATAPMFELPSADGDKVSLAELLRQGPVVLSFYRGGWCPYCNLELRALQRALPEITRLGATLVAVSPETPDHSLKTAEKHTLQFHVLSDVGNTVARQFGLVFALPHELRPMYKQIGIDIPQHNGDERYELPIPATFVIDREQIIRFAFVDVDYASRAEPADIIAALQRISCSATTECA